MELKQAIEYPLPEVGVFQLETIFELQKTMMEPFIKTEGLPPYPININLKENQKLIKDFISRVTEELCEAYEKYELASTEYFDEFRKTGLHEHLDKLINLFNEECSDAIHFMVELLIYVNIDANAVKDYYLMDLQNSDPLNLSRIENTLELITKYSDLFLQFSGKKGTPANHYLLDKHEFNKAGRKFGVYTNEEIKSMIFLTIYKLNMAANCLKNKPWRKTVTETNEDKFQKYVMDAFMQMIHLLVFLGNDHNSIFKIYFTKNLINIERSKTNY